MSAVLRPGLAVRRYRAGVVIRHHHDKSRPEHHQKGQEIPRPLGLHYSPANLHHFRFQAGRGIHHKFVVHRHFSFPPAREDTTGITACQAIPTPQTGTNTYWRLSKGENSSSKNWSVAPQPSAFTTVSSVEEAAAKAIA